MPDFICGATNKALSEGKDFYSFGAGLLELRQKYPRIIRAFIMSRSQTNRLRSQVRKQMLFIMLCSLFWGRRRGCCCDPIGIISIGITELAGGHIVEFRWCRVSEAGHWIWINHLLRVPLLPKRCWLWRPITRQVGRCLLRNIKRVTEFGTRAGTGLLLMRFMVVVFIMMCVRRAFLDYSGDDDRLYVINSF